MQKKIQQLQANRGYVAREELFLITSGMSTLPPCHTYLRIQHGAHWWNPDVSLVFWYHCVNTSITCLDVATPNAYCFNSRLHDSGISHLQTADMTQFSSEECDISSRPVLDHSEAHDHRKTMNHNGNMNHNNTINGALGGTANSSLNKHETFNHNGIDGHVNKSPVEPIAIIGMSCRLPGSAQDPSSLWDMLTSGRTAWTSGPGARFNMNAFQDPSGEKSGMVRQIAQIVSKVLMANKILP